jgi:hypothetical protein
MVVWGLKRLLQGNQAPAILFCVEDQETEEVDLFMEEKYRKIKRNNGICS